MRRLLWLVFLLFLSSSAFTQISQKTYTILEIHGLVLLPSSRSAGAGVQVQLLAAGGGISQEITTDSTGKFSFPSVSPVHYEIRAHLPGYIDADSGDIDMSMSSSQYIVLALRADPRAPNVPPEGAGGMISALPSDMPEAAKTAFNEGFAIVTSGKDLDKAIPSFKKAIDLYPKYAPSYLMLGTVYAHTNHPDEAIAPLQKAIELDPKKDDAYTQLGTIYNGQKKFPEAEQNLSKAVELAPTSFDAQYQLGRTYYAMQKPADAQQHLSAALQANPKSAEAHIVMANVMLRLRNAEAALKEYQTGVDLDPQGPMADGARQMIAKIQAALAAQKK